MKKIALLLVAVALIFGCLTVNIFAADAVSITVSDAEAGRNGEMEVTISVTENPGFIAMQLLVEYDKNVLELVGVTDAGMYGSAMHTKDLTKYPYPLTWNNGTAEENYTNCDKMVTLKFKVKSDASFGSTEINVSLKPGGCLNYDMNKLDLNDVVPAKATVICPHTNKVSVEAADATCTEEGKKAHWHCPDCNKNFTTEACDTVFEGDVVIAALGHNPKKIEAVAATCTKEGNVEYWQCQREGCGKNFSDEACKTEVEKITTDKVAHTPGEWITTDKENHWQTCTVCNEEIEGSRAAHNESEPETVPATCTEAKKLGATKCTVCGRAMKEAGTEGEPLGHDPKHYTRTEATCTEAGNVEYWECQREGCGKKYSDEACTAEITETIINALGHDMTKVDAVAATCTKEGNVEYWHCNTCDKNFADDKGVDAIDNVVTETVAHTLGDYVSDKDNHWKVCSVCNQEFEKVAHIPGNAESHTDATCTEPERFGAVKCTVCGYVISEGEVGKDALGHDKAHHEFKDSTCTELGNVEYWECKRCGKNYSDEDCTAEITETVIQMKEHTYAEHAEDPADHHKSGMSMYYTCQTCDKVFDSSKNETTLEALVIAQIPHDNITEWTNDGENHWHQCSCGDKFDVAAHEPEIRDEQNATCTEAGSKGGTYCKICDKCIAEGGEVIPALGHDLTEVAAKDATCYAAGNVQYWHCGRCGKNYSDAAATTIINDVTIAQLKHNFVSGKCTLCGADDPNYYSAPVYAPVNDQYHAVISQNGAASYQPHTPSMLGIKTDGKYQWKICSSCGTIYDKVLIADNNPDDVTVTEPDDTEEIVVKDPIEPNTTDEETENTTVEEPKTEPEDTNPKTGIVLSFAVVSAAALAMVFGKKR